MNSENIKHLIVRHKWLIMAILLLICLFNMPYFYYQLIRFLTTIVFSISAIYYEAIKNNKMAITMFVLVIIFQPVEPIVWERVIWKIIDVLVAIFLLNLWYKEVWFKIKNNC